jgi:hypothetical protein
MTEIKRMDIAEFRDAGYLQEVNRRFFHPLGLALEVEIDKDGKEHLSGIWDYRDDPEGMIYEGDLPDAQKAEHIRRIELGRVTARIDALGYWVQPATEV